MYCVNCGKEIADTDKVCRFCGKPVESSSASQDNVVVETVVDEPAVVSASEQTIVQTNKSEVVEVDSSQVTEALDSSNIEIVTAKNKMPKKKKFTILGICAALVAVIVVGVVLFWDYVENTVVNTFSSSDKYYSYVEEKNVDELAESIGATLGKFNEVFAENAKNGAKSEISIHLGDVLIDALAKNMDIDKSQISWASNISLTDVASSKGGLSANNMQLLVNNKTILNIELVFKMEDLSYYLRIPELNKDYVLFNIPVVQDSEMNTEALMKIYKAFPDEETITELVSRYLTIAIRNIKEVEKQKASVVANGVEQSCTELTVNIDDKVIVDIVEALLKEFKNDNEVKNVIKNFYLAVESSSNDFESKYSELIADVDKFLSDIDEFEKELENINLTVVTWVDSKGEVIGREIKSTEFDGKIRYLSTHNGTKVGIEAYFLTDESEGIEILGNGNIKNSKMTGNLEIFAVGVNGDAKLSVANISIKDYDVDSIDDNYINGVFTITLSDAICDELAKEFDLPKTITDYLKKGSVVVSITSNEGKGSVTLAVLYDSKDVIEVSVNIAENKASNVKIPENAIKIQEESDLLNYVENINLDTIKSNLKAAGAPSDLVDALFLQMGQQDNHVEDNSPNFSYSDNLDYGGMYY